ncbi:MAG: efflux transporter periplasmic adaptor subunit, partial [Nevskiales bacterium]
MKLHQALPVVAIPLLLALAACGKPPAKPEEIRPVRSIVVNVGSVDAGNTYAGEVRPRYESDLGFRVAGKILNRSINVGDVVKSGQA